jgi:hypothetical protein
LRSNRWGLISIGPDRDKPLHALTSEHRPKRSMSVMGIYRQLPQRPPSAVVEQVNKSGQPFKREAGHAERESPHNSQYSRNRRVRVEDEDRQPN